MTRKSELFELGISSGEMIELAKDLRGNSSDEQNREYVLLKVGFRIFKSAQCYVASISTVRSGVEVDTDQVANDTTNEFLTRYLLKPGKLDAPGTKAVGLLRMIGRHRLSNAIRSGRRHSRHASRVDQDDLLNPINCLSCPMNGSAMIETVDAAAYMDTLLKDETLRPVYKLMLLERTNEEISKELNWSIVTVKRLVVQIRVKHGARIILASSPLQLEQQTK